ncbi:MAG: hypothetical protein P9M15_02520, partial [Candidatus Electryoneaceae bacterium]|nr:hypothetical protein [Candidatus Electryoneaceae bacterium]
PLNHSWRLLRHYVPRKDRMEHPSQLQNCPPQFTFIFRRMQPGSIQRHKQDDIEHNNKRLVEPDHPDTLTDCFKKLYITELTRQIDKGRERVDCIG